MKDGRGIELRGEFGREDDERGNLALVHTRMHRFWAESKAKSEFNIFAKRTEVLPLPDLQNFPWP